uniref:RRM domain-containing protein n=1 Tax=Pavo cristatus TaxID=9049 RepID=A0A8C9EUJ2_PAVCR
MRDAFRAPLGAQRACAEAERRSPHGCAGAVPAPSREGQGTCACAAAGAPCREAAWVGGARSLRLRGGGGGALWDTAAQAGCSGAMASSSGTDVIQVTNVSPSASSEQMRTLFGFLGKIEELRLFPPDDSPLPVSSRVCFVKFHDPDSAVVAQHLTNTVFVDRALIVVPYAEVLFPGSA